MFTVTWCKYNWTNNSIRWSHQWLRSQGLMAQHSETQYVTVSSRYVLHYLCPSSQKCLVITFNTKFLTSNMHGTYGCASQTPRVCYISHAKIVPGWMLIWVNFDPIQKIGVGILSQDNGKCAHLKFKVSGCKQVSKHTHAQCSHTSVRLTQTWPND